MLRCLSARSLLDRREAGLVEAERIRLEDHLGACAACRTEKRRREELRALAESVPPPALTAVARERVMARALAGASRDAHADDPGPAARRRRNLTRGSGIGAVAVVVVVVASAVAAAAAVTAALWIGSDAGAPATPDRRLRPADGLRSGDLSAAGRPVALGGAVPAGVVLHSDGGAFLDLGPARVELAPATRARWERASDTLALEAGFVRVSVESSAGNEFRVATLRFAAEVTGTEFEVDLGGVRVSRGRVRVMSPDGAVLALLSAGEMFRAGALEPTVGSLSFEEPAGAPAATATAPPPAATATAPPPATPRAAPAEPGPSLAEARRALAHGDVTAARSLVKRAMGVRLSRVQEAEARTLLADAAAVAGEPDRAIELYLEVAGRFADLPAGEAALFAASRSSGAERPDRARALLTDYLSRYPEGRFRREVEARLRVLSEKAP